MEGDVNLVEVGDDLVEETEALGALVVLLHLLQEVGEAREGGEDDAHRVVGPAVQLAVTCTHRLNYIGRKEEG